MRPWPRATNLASTVSLVVMLGCGGHPPASATLPPSYAEAATTVRDGERPPVTVIRREGDPVPVMALAIAHDAGPAWGRGFARQLDGRLTKLGLQPKSTLFTRGLVVSFAVGKGAESAVAGLRQVVANAASEAAADPVSTALDPCDPVPAFEDEPPELGRQNVAFSLVGAEDQVERLVELLAEGESWPKGDVPGVALPDADLYVLHQGPGPDVSFSLVTTGSTRLHDARQALLQNPLLHEVLREFPPGFSLTELAASASSGSGCLWATLDARTTPGRQDAAALVSVLRELFETELSRAPASSRLLPAVVASSATEAAELAAWQGLIGDEEASGTRFISVLRSEGGSKVGALTDVAFEREVRRARTNERLKVESRVEKGQGRIWAALTSACPVAHETRNDAGYTALGFEHAVRALAERETLTTWGGFGGPALVAHAPALNGGAEQTVADALAEGVLRSLEAGPELSRVAREKLDATPGSDLVDFAAEMITHGHPSRVMAHGTRDSLSRVNPLHVRTALLGFLSTPLSLVVSSNEDETQGLRVAERLERLLKPFLPATPSCPTPKDAAVPGTYVLHVDGPRADVVLAFPVPVDQLGAARAVAFLLERKGGFLEQSLLPSGLTSHASAKAIGSRGGLGALVVALDAEPEAVPAATQQIRALMQRISGGAIQERHHRAVLGAWGAPPGRTPLERIFREAGPLRAPSLDELRRFAHSYLTEEKLVIVHARDRE